MRRMAVLLVIFLCGCTAAQVHQEFIGYRIKDVKAAKNKQVETYDMSAEECFNKLKAAIVDIKANVRWADEGRLYIIADCFNSKKLFKSCIDTTQVGILTTSLGQNKCQVEIASGNNDLAVFVSKKLNNRLRGIVEPEDEKRAEDTHDKKDNAG